jgi:hypothetical protein
LFHFKPGNRLFLCLYRPFATGVSYPTGKPFQTQYRAIGEVCWAKIRGFMEKQARWQQIKFWLKIALVILTIFIAIRIGIKSKNVIMKIMRFFGFKDDEANSQVTIQQFEKVDTGNDKSNETKNFIEAMKSKYLKGAT